MTIQRITKRIWLVGGTQESAELAQALDRSHIPCIVSVTTESARSLYPSTSPGRSIDRQTFDVWVGQLDAFSITDFIQTHQISAILDVSHPFAVAISQLAIATAAELHLPYLRYERPTYQSQKFTNHDQNTLENNSFQPQTNSSQTHLPLGDSLLTFPDVPSFLSSHALVGQRTLLTIGYRFLPLFQPWQERATLFVRILPSIPALEAAIEAGFSTDRILALRPPFSAELERSLWQHWQISMVVTKASGTPGGEDIKRQVAAELGVKLVIISRPEITYPQQTSDLSVALAFCRQALTAP